MTPTPFTLRLAAHAGLPVVSLRPDDPGAVPVSALATQLLDAAVCRRLGVLPVAFADGCVTVATSSPAVADADELGPLVGGRAVRLVVAEADEVAAAIEEHLPPAAEAPIAGPVDGRVTEPEYPTRLGDLLVARGLATDAQVAGALAEQERSGARVGEALVAAGVIAEADLVAMLAEQLDLPLVDLEAFEPDPAALELLPEPLARRLRCVPIAADATTLYLAVAEPIGEQTAAALHEHTQLELRGFLATRSAIDELLQRVHGDRYLAVAASDLEQRFPDASGRRIATRPQLAVLLLALAAVAAGLAVAPHTAGTTLALAVAAVSLVASGHRVWLALRGAARRRAPAPAPLADRDLPAMAVLVALRDDARELAGLLDALEGLDYPASRLSVRLLCADDDTGTRAALRGVALPANATVVVVPPSAPRTLGHALNFGLLQADGDVVVALRATDRPAPDQLRLAAAALAGPDAPAAVQALLEPAGRPRGLMARLAMLEHWAWATLLAPGLEAAGSPLLPAATSMYVPADRLAAAAAWDPHSPAPGTDLGVRLRRAGGRTALLDSATRIRSRRGLPAWLDERSRVYAGWLRTWAVHTRHPLTLVREVGLRSALALHLLVGGVAALLLQPVAAALTVLLVLAEAGVVGFLLPAWVLVTVAAALGAAVATLAGIEAAAALARRRPGAALLALIAPLQLGLLSLAAWRALVRVRRRVR